MFIIAFIYFLEIVLCILVLYSIYKVIWYSVKMLALRKMIKSLNSENTTVTYKRNFWSIIFGKKGIVDFVVTTPEQKYEVCVISFISTHSRWNIEKTRNNYYVEARRFNKLFYKVDVHSEQPDHAIQYRRETRFQRSQLLLNSTCEEGVRKVLLIYPLPKQITYTSSKYEYLRTGSLVEGYEVMYMEDLLKLVSEPQINKQRKND